MIERAISMKNSLKIMLAAFLLSLSGCSTLQLAYNNAGFLLKYYISDYVELTDSQSEFVDRELTKMMNWHRKSELPVYIKFIDESKQKINRGLTDDDLKWGYSKFRERYVHTVDFLFPSLLDFFSGLSPEQITGLEKKYTADRAKSEERNAALTREDHLHKRYDSMVASLEDWVGDLTDSQLELVKQASYEMPFNRGLFIEERIRRQKEFIQILRTSKSKAELKTSLYIYLTDLKNGRSEEYLDYQKKQEESVYKFTLRLDKILTKEQKGHFIENIDEYRSSFAELLEE